MSEPTPNLFFETVKAYQRTAALKSAIELGVFEAIAQDHTNATQLAKHCQSTERGINILCDYLTVKGFLNKSNNRYQLTPDSETFLNPKSTEYLGSAIDFLLSEPMLTAFQNLTKRRHSTPSRRYTGPRPPRLDSLRQRHGSRYEMASTTACRIP